MPRFAILCHDSPRGRHWDFLVEAGDVLKTWALAEWPQSDVELTCEALPDHRLAYLDYEGEISGGRGTVARCDGGTCQTRSDDAGRLLVEICGARLSGLVLLEPIADQPGQWRFRWTAS